MLQHARKNFAGFIASFSTEKCMDAVLEREKVKVPESWTRDREAFLVVEDCGTILVLGFLNFATDDQVGDTTFEVAREEVICWA